MPTDIPAHAPFTGEPGAEPEYAPGEFGGEVEPSTPEELPHDPPFEGGGAPAE